MIGKFVLAALIAGLTAGFLYGGVQYLRTTPLIIAAEVFETMEPAAHNHSAEASATTALQASPTPQEHQHDTASWAPTDGWQRTLSTTIASMITGAGFALLLAAVSLLTGLPITPANSLVWGIAGFLAVTVAPGAGLPPELPGMPAADLVARQVWWLATIVATGAAIYLIATRRKPLWLATAVVLIALPHLIGAPQPLSQESAIPAGLAASFAANTIAASAVLWSLIGLFLSYAMKKYGQEIIAS